MATITREEILNSLVPKCCAYLWNDSSLIEIPQNEEELKTVIDVVKKSDFKIVENSKALKLGYKELAKWSNENDYLFLFQTEYMLLCMPISVFMHN